MDDQLHELKTKVALVEQALQHLRDEVKKFVTHDQFYSVRLLSHGLAGLILTSVVGALIASALK